MEYLDKHWQCFNEKCSQRDRCVPCRANLENVKQLIHKREREVRISELERVVKTPSDWAEHTDFGVQETARARIEQLKKEG